MSRTKTFLMYLAFTIITVGILTSSLWMPRLRRSKAATPVAIPSWPTESVVVAAEEVKPPCKHYGHAVLPCGVQSLADLSSLIPAYKNFDFSHARLEKLDHDLFAFVSYKLNGRIYSSSRIERIPAGEEVWTDGNGNYIRARCGNLISFVPLNPISPDEPTDIDNVVPVPNISTENGQPPDTTYTPAPPITAPQPVTTATYYTPPAYFPDYVPVGEVPTPITVPETFPRFILPLTLVCILFVASVKGKP